MIKRLMKLKIKFLEKRHKKIRQRIWKTERRKFTMLLNPQLKKSKKLTKNRKREPLLKRLLMPLRRLQLPLRKAPKMLRKPLPPRKLSRKLKRPLPQLLVKTERTAKNQSQLNLSEHDIIVDIPNHKYLSNKS